MSPQPGEVSVTTLTHTLLPPEARYTTEDPYQLKSTLFPPLLRSLVSHSTAFQDDLRTLQDPSPLPRDFSGVLLVLSRPTAPVSSSHPRAVTGGI